jgi:hypothetical protein
MKLYENEVKEAQNNVTFHLTYKRLSTDNYWNIIHFTDEVELTSKNKTNFQKSME